MIWRAAHPKWDFIYMVITFTLHRYMQPNNHFPRGCQRLIGSYQKIGSLEFQVFRQFLFARLSFHFLQVDFKSSTFFYNKITASAFFYSQQLEIRYSGSCHFFKTRTYRRFCRVYYSYFPLMNAGFLFHYRHSKFFKFTKIRLKIFLDVLHYKNSDS